MPRYKVVAYESKRFETEIESKDKDTAERDAVDIEWEEHHEDNEYYEWEIASIEEIDKEKLPELPWKYCECGCKGLELKICGLYFWKTMTFNDDYSIRAVWVNRHRHGILGDRLGNYKSNVEADKAVLEIVKKEAEVIKEQLDSLGLLTTEE